MSELCFPSHQFEKHKPIPVWMNQNVALPMCRSDGGLEVTGRVGETKDSLALRYRPHIFRPVVPGEAFHHNFTAVGKFGAR